MGLSVTSFLVPESETTSALSDWANLSYKQGENRALPNHPYYQASPMHVWPVWYEICPRFLKFAEMFLLKALLGRQALLISCHVLLPGEANI